MKQLRFHLLGLAHLATHKKNSACAYTQKVVKLARILKSHGHQVFFYGVEGSEVECDEFIQVSTQDVLEQTYGQYDQTREFFKHHPQDFAHRTFNANTIKEINARKADRDFLLCPMGNYQEPIARAVNLLTVEPGIGYTGVFSAFRVFESYAWMHYVYGLLKQDDGVWYDAAIPNYYDVADFPFEEQKEDYLLYFGRIIRRKGVQVAADVAKATGHQLYVVGQGALDNPQEGLALSREEHINTFRRWVRKKEPGCWAKPKQSSRPPFIWSPSAGSMWKHSFAGPR